MVATYGLEKPWAKVEKMHFADQETAPFISYPHWIASAELPVDYPSAETPGEADNG